MCFDLCAKECEISMWLLSERLSELNPSCPLEKFAEEKRFQSKKSAITFIPSLRGRFLNLWQRMFHQGWQNRILFTEKTLREGRFVCRKKTLSTNLLYLSKKFPVFLSVEFQQFCQKAMPVFRRRFWEWILFFVKKNFPFVIPSNSSVSFEKTVFAVLSKLHSTCSEIFLDVFFFEKKSVPKSFLDTEPKNSGFWYVCHSCFACVHCKILRKKKDLKWKNWLSISLSEVDRKKFGFLAKRGSKFCHRNIHQGWENCILSYWNVFSEKQVFFVEKVSFIEIIRPKQQTPVFCWNIFSRIIGGPSQFFGNLRGSFCVTKNISFCCSIKQFWDFRRNIFCSAVKTSFSVSGWYSRRVFFRILAFVGKLLSKKLVAFSEKPPEMKSSFIRINFCVLNYQQRKTFGQLKYTFQT